MDSLEFTNRITSLIESAISIQESHDKVNKLYSIHPEEVAFAKNEIASNTDLDTKADTMIKLYIAFFLDYIPTQIVNNLKNKSELYKGGDEVKDYMILVAGMLHSAKTVLLEENETMLPYLTAYNEFIGIRGNCEIPEEELNLFFASIIDEAIQTLIAF